MRDIRIPQDLKTSDKLIGPFSMKQVMVIVAGIGVSYVFFAMAKSAFGGKVPAAAHAFIWLPAILTAVFAVVRINDISMGRYSLLVIEMFSKPRQRCFHARVGIPTMTKMTPQKKKKKKDEKDTKGMDIAEESKKSMTLEDLSLLMDHAGVEKAAQDAATKRDNVAMEAVLLGESTEKVEERRKKIDALITQPVKTES